MGGYVAYPEYKDSGVEWIQYIPKNWRMKRLKFTVELINQKVDAESSDLSYMGLEHIEPWTGKRIEDETASSEGIATRFLPDDVLFGKLRPYLAKVHLAKHEGLVSTEALVLRKSGDIEASFLRYYLVSKDFINIVDSSTYGSKMPRASWDFIGNLPILIPGNEEQQIIARFLDYKTAQIDALIAKKEALLKKLAEKRTALISHAVTKGLDPSAPMKDSGVPWLGDIPAHWDIKRLKFLTSIVGGGTPNTNKPEYWNGDIPWVSPKDMKSDSIYKTEESITEIGVNECATKIIKSDAVLIVVRSGILRHTIPTARNFVDVTLNQDMKALLPNKSISSAYLQRFIQGNQRALLPLWSKSGCTVESIEYAYMANTGIPIPPIKEQEEIVTYIGNLTRHLDNQCLKIENAINKLKEYRTALITQAVTGKIDLREVPIPVQ